MKIYNYNDFPINLTKVALTHKESFKKSPSTILSTKQLTKFYENQLKSNNLLLFYAQDFEENLLGAIFLKPNKKMSPINYLYLFKYFFLPIV